MPIPRHPVQARHAGLHTGRLDTMWEMAMRSFQFSIGWRLAAALAVGVLPLSGLAQPTAGQAAAAAGGSSTSANGGTGGVGLGGTGPGVATRPGAAGGAGSMDGAKPAGNGALVGPRAASQSREIMAERPERAASAPRNTGQRALLLDEARRPGAATSAPVVR